MPLVLFIVSRRDISLKPVEELKVLSKNLARKWPCIDANATVFQLRPDTFLNSPFNCV